MKLSAANEPHPAVSTGWPELDSLIGIGGYPRHRLTHISGEVEQLRALTKTWGWTATLTTFDGFTITERPQQLVVDATAVEHDPNRWDFYSLRALRSTVVWLTSAEQVTPMVFKTAAFLRLQCEGDRVTVIRSAVSARNGYFASLALPLQGESEPKWKTPDTMMSGAKRSMPSWPTQCG